MPIIQHPSPNFNARPDDAHVKYVVVHYTDMKSAKEALDRLADPAAKVSAHYLIAEDGTIYQLVNETMRAWHAGVSSWHGAPDINSTSIGIELDHPGHQYGYRAFDARQIASLKELLGDIYARHKLKPESLLAHSDIAPTRKIDPGELFPWEELAKNGFGVWPQANAPAAPVNLAHVPQLLQKLGYEAPQQPWQPERCKVLEAFQRRYDPTSLGQGLTPTTVERLRRLIHS